MNQTALAYLLTRVLDTPFWGLFNLIPFILYKDLKATPFQLALVIAMRPLVSILSSYWSTRAAKMPHGLRSSLFYGRVFAYLPFLAIPWINSSWYLIFCSGLYMLLQVGMMPSWMELLNRNLEAKVRDKVFSYAQAFGYLGGGLLPFALGWVLDKNIKAWAFMFPIAALVGLTAYFWQKKIVYSTRTMTTHPNPFIQPWKNSWELLKRRKDFAKFQLGFMWIGAGLMIIQPTLPVFFVDTLNLSYTELGVAITLCKGIGFASGTPFWHKWIQRVNFFFFGAVIATLAIVFTGLLVASQMTLVSLYLAYLVYGLMQAGNELSWNMSGPIFAQGEDSSPYSTINVIAVGIRGIFIPLLGAFCLAQFGPFSSLYLSALFCFIAACTMLHFSRSNYTSNEIIKT